MFDSIPQIFPDCKGKYANRAKIGGPHADASAVVLDIGQGAFVQVENVFVALGIDGGNGGLNLLLEFFRLTNCLYELRFRDGVHSVDNMVSLLSRAVAEVQKRLQVFGRVHATQQAGVEEHASVIPRFASDIRQDGFTEPLIARAKAATKKGDTRPANVL